MNALERTCTAVLLPLGFAASAGAQPIITRPFDGEFRNVHVLYYDDSFLFVSRHAGNSNDPGGNTQLTLLVHSKKHARWLQIFALTTKGARFGSSYSTDSAAARTLMMISMGWNHGHCASHAYVALTPVERTTFFSTPDTVAYEAGEDRYLVGFHTHTGVAGAETILYIERQDLVRAFDTAPPPWERYVPSVTDPALDICDAAELATSPASSALPPASTGRRSPPAAGGAPLTGRSP